MSIDQDPDIGHLDATTAAELQEAIVGHQVDVAEAEAAAGYMNAVIFRATALMRARGCPEHRITKLAAETRAEPLAKWVKALRGTDDFGPWDD